MNLETRRFFAMRSIALVSEKGGVSKTTVVLNLAAGLAARGHKVLVVDVDPQGNSSHVLLRGDKPRHPALREVLLAEAEAREAIVSSLSFEGVDVLPADHTLADAAVALANEVGRERRLRLAMQDVAKDYSFVLVDTAPTRSLLSTNVLNFVDELLVPIVPSLFGLLGLGQLQADVGQVVKFLDNKNLRIGGILLSIVERNNVVRSVEEQLRQLFGPLVLETRIPRNLKIEEAHSRFQSIQTYAPMSPGAAAFEALTKEILGHDEAKRRRGSSARNPSSDRAA
jgi:chromosome partitioning protein